LIEGGAVKRSFIDLIAFLGGLGMFIIPIITGLLNTEETFVVWMKLYSGQYWYTYIFGVIFIVVSFILPIIRGKIYKN
jgi:hypothetical protein